MTKKEIGNFLYSLEHIISLLNLYSHDVDDKCLDYLGSKKKKKQLEKDLDYSSTSLLAIENCLMFLEPFMSNYDIEIAYDEDIKEFFLLHKGKLIEFVEEEFNPLVEETEKLIIEKEIN